MTVCGKGGGGGRLACLPWARKCVVGSHLFDQEHCIAADVGQVTSTCNMVTG